MQANSPTVSVIILSYNHSKFVVECLDSLLHQTFTDWELIVADDASKDSSVTIIEQWLAQNNVKAKCNFHKVNTGVCTVLNECIELCNGTYIKAIAADDMMHPNLLAEVVTAFENGPEDLGVVYTNALFINEHSKSLEKTILPESPLPPQGWVREQLEESNFVPAPSVALKKKVYDKIGKYDTTIITDDYDCWMRASVYFQFLYINKALVLYRTHQHNISNSIDFSADELKIWIKNDFEGKLKMKIEQKIRDRYYAHKIDNSLVMAYSKYTKPYKWLLFCLKSNMPYYIFRIIDKLQKKGN